MARIGGNVGVPHLGDIPVVKRKVADLEDAVPIIKEETVGLQREARKRYQTLRRLGKHIGKHNVLSLKQKRERELREREKKLLKRIAVVAKWRKRLGWDEEEYFG